MNKEIEYRLPQLMQRVYRYAALSNDRNTHNCAVLIRDNAQVVTVGWNHFVNGFGDKPEHHERPFKYSVTEHAERAATYVAAYSGMPTVGLTMVSNWAACPDCARAIQLAGIKELIVHKECMARTPERWADMVNLGLEILTRGGVKVTYWSGKVGIKNLNNGEVWEA